MAYKYINVTDFAPVMDTIVFTVIKLGILLILWFLVFMLLKKGFNYINHPKTMFAIFFFLTAAAFYLNKTLLWPFVESFTFAPFVFLAIAVVFVYLIYFLAHKYLRNPDKIIRYLPGQPNLAFRYVYIFPKLMNLFFQQTMVLSFIAVLLQFFQPDTVILIMPLLFCLLHAVVLFTDGFKAGMIYVCFSCLGGFIFAVLILNVNYGFVYNIIVQWVFYICLGLYFWVRYTLDEKYRF